MYSKNATFRIGRVHSRGLHHEPLRLIAAGEFDPTRIASTAKWEDATTRLLYEDNVKLLITREHERS
jgi:alcohol dehydrogenase